MAPEREKGFKKATVPFFLFQRGWKFLQMVGDYRGEEEGGNYVLSKRRWSQSQVEYILFWLDKIKSCFNEKSSPPFRFITDIIIIAS